MGDSNFCTNDRIVINDFPQNKVKRNEKKYEQINNYASKYSRFEKKKLMSLLYPCQT